ncbi:MAG: hypothetical protein JW841_09155 [Deltaproteobacteria bacterium]|nr:hypothetical protein [Deltaproteobacteria bacterium]
MADATTVSGGTNVIIILLMLGVSGFLGYLGIIGIKNKKTFLSGRRNFNNAGDIKSITGFKAQIIGILYLLVACLLLYKTFF